jgi:hypothetical protein
VGQGVSVAVGSSRALRRSARPTRTLRAASRSPNCSRRITDLDGQIDAARQGLADRLDVERHRPELADEHQKLSEALGTDWTLRKFDITDRGVSRSVTALIGPRPSGHDASQLWLEAAAAIEQHQSVFDITDGLGAEPSCFGTDLYADSYRKVRQVTDDYNHAVDRTVPQ